MILNIIDIFPHVILTFPLFTIMRNKFLLFAKQYLCDAMVALMD